MRFRINPYTPDPRLKPHKWFAWYPVQISGSTIAWLEFVIRQGSYDTIKNISYGRKMKFTYSSPERNAA